MWFNWFDFYTASMRVLSSAISKMTIMMVNMNWYKGVCWTNRLNIVKFFLKIKFKINIIDAMWKLVKLGLYPSSWLSLCWYKFAASDTKTTTDWSAKIKENLIFIEGIEDAIFTAIQQNCKVEEMHQQKWNVPINKRWTCFQGNFKSIEWKYKFNDCLTMSQTAPARGTWNVLRRIDSFLIILELICYLVYRIT